MHIDLMQLPIPHDWDLHCPRCDYPLGGLDRHRCPECGELIDVPSLLKTWTRVRDPVVTGLDLPFPECGLTCASCNAVLDGAVERRCPNCSRPFDPEAMKPRARWFRVERWMHPSIPLPVVNGLLSEAFIPYVHHPPLNALMMGEGLGHTEVDGDFYFEFLWLMQQRRRSIHANADEPGEGWDCRACGEHNPADFEVCWSCGEPRP